MTSKDVDPANVLPEYPRSQLIRKHIKVELYRWYYWADKLVLIVWQDMPSPNSYTDIPQSITQVAYERELTQLMEQHWNSPSIIMWVIFNES